MTDYSDIATVRLLSGLTTTEISDANITSLLTLASREIDQTTNQSWGNGTSYTDYRPVYLPVRADNILPNRILLSNYPVQSITGFAMLDSVGTVLTNLATLTGGQITAGTYYTSDYFVDPSTGVIELTSRTFDYVPSRAMITYTAGHSTVPTYVNELSATIASIRAWAYFLGGNYDRLNSYSLPEQSYNKGEFYTRGLQLVGSLRQRAEELFEIIGTRQRSQFEITSGGYYDTGGLSMGGSNVGGVSVTYSIDFTNSDLSSGVLTITHNLGQQNVFVQIMDNNNLPVAPDQITMTSTTACTVNLGSQGAIAGTWNAVVST